jgi:hypothetical protein
MKKVSKKEFWRLQALLAQYSGSQPFLPHMYVLSSWADYGDLCFNLSIRRPK